MTTRHLTIRSPSPRACAPQHVVAAAALVVLGAGCYAYAPVPGAATTLAGRSVELALTDSGAVVVRTAIGPAAEAIVGRLVADTNGTYVISVGSVRRRDGADATWTGERLALPHALTAGVRERRFSLLRTAIAAAGAVGLVVGGRAALGGLNGSNAGRNETPPGGSAK